MHIHILGIGNVGKLIAHGLAKSAIPPTITLLFHRSNLLKEWEAHGSSLELVTQGVSDFSTGYRTETIAPADSVTLTRPQDQDIITNLIVATKTTKTVIAIQSIRHRLTRDSTIMLAQNGMGVIDELNASVFPDITSRPRYTGAVVMHGIYTKHTFASIHAGPGTMTISSIPEVHSETRTINDSTHLLDTLSAAPILGTKVVPPHEFLSSQLEKLAINSSMSALSAILDCKYGDLFHSPTHTSRNQKNWRIAQQTIQEISRVILTMLETYESNPDMRIDIARFSPTALERKVLGTAELVARSYSSMVEDVRAGRETEIGYLNGYVVRKGKELGLRCPVHEGLVELVVGSRDRDKLYGLLGS
ncbi:2-dehydropantoate 2-reductase-like protein [Aaosphaeria arxii CBS 175.79]|uniref:2-dehydropantoate 2-reductase n=1 Tax=Aaosphaeria arxii CBS 175.79 TaxID=1450172 RepID=A0A6A5XH20_9PLEO|nr:2-dehydropantoate 2-reductase-like protein [Aaosphaeria arxii CBS 175.79]KAF2012091.1 2-dehydropantoate 2-reductase-like protein [Aaosphaeria arxii CBS 175.79]